MDTSSVLTILAIIAIIYFFVKFIVSPIIKALVGVIVFLIILYILKNYFNFDLNKVFGPYTIFFDITKWGINLSLVLDPINNLVNIIINFIKNLKT